jgi:hypothetical protein
MNINNLLNNCNDEQIKFILSPLENSKLIGIPGGGKTTAIIKKIICHKLKNDLQCNNNFLIVTFSRKACTDFKQRGNSIIPSTFDEKNVKTIHSLANSISKKINKKECNSVDIIVASVINIIKTESVESLKTLNSLAKLKLIIVDEAQDISATQYEFIKNLSEKLGTYLILVGDPNQNIYQFQNGSDKYLIEHKGQEYSLIKNHRSTQEIVDVVNLFRPWKHKFPSMISGNKLNGRKPVIYCGDIKNYLTKILLNEIKTSKYKLDEIAIIGPVKKSNSSKDGQLLNIGLQYFVNLFNEHKIKYIQHYSASSKDAEVVNEHFETKPDHINLFTIHGSKGLEFKKVILLNFHLSTYGRVPNNDDYNKFRYLWYVGISRAKEELVILVDKNKKIWNVHGLINNLHLFELKGENPYFAPLIFDNKLQQPLLFVTELIKNKNIFTEEDLLYLNNNLNFSTQISTIYDVSKEEYFDFNKYSDLYGLYIEKLAEYYYCKNNNKVFKTVQNIKNGLSNIVWIDNEFSITAISLLKKLGQTLNTYFVMSLQQINKIKDFLNNAEMHLFEELKIMLNNDFICLFTLWIKNPNISYDTKYICSLCDNILTGQTTDILYELFEISFYFYQINSESKYLWDKRKDFYDKMIDLLRPTIKNIENYMNKYDGKLNFQEYIKSDYIETMNGIIDAYDYLNNKIIEFKFVKNVSLLHYLQIFLYNCILNPDWKKFAIMEIINFYDGTKHKLDFNPLITHFDLLNKLIQLINKVDKTKKITNICLVYDLEATGLIENKQNGEIYPDIIERCFYEPKLNICIDDGLVKPLDIIPSLRFIWNN